MLAVCFFSLTHMHTHPLIYMDIKTPKRTYLLQNLNHFQNHRSQCHYHNAVMSLMTASGSVNSSSSSVQRGCSFPSHLCQLCPSFAFGVYEVGTCALFQTTVWKLACLACCTRLLRHGGSADKSMFVLKLIVSFLHFSFSM